MERIQSLTQSTRPRAPSDRYDTIVRSSRYAKLNGDDFYRGIADDRAALFASTGQLNMLKVAKEVYFDAIASCSKLLLFEA